ncbi:exocyst complex component 1-like [Sycon ciliatum]|uniref:exocyst complex component 1-like n=1 Tax=Sycon ciliatum TaxID=27933 RepID=UPI0020A8438F|eukprot:scpid35838/ scgid11875/ Exocyst complex component 1; Exocyst complex component Sec3
MAAIRHILQKDVFTPAEERLVGVVSVTKHGQKRKAGNTVFLCATVTNEKPQSAAVHKVKKTADKDSYKKKQTWSLSDMSLVDGKDADVDTPEFDLHFDKVYRWVASSLADKNSFINCVWKLCHRYLRRVPHFTNVNSDRLEDHTETTESIHGTASAAAADDYQELTTADETDLKQIMDSCNWAIGNAEAFTEKLAEELSGLDGANIHAIMGSEAQVQELIKLLDQALWELENTESRLSDYDALLRAVRDSMELMEEKDNSLRVEDQNRRKLVTEIENLVNELSLSAEHVSLLEHGDLRGKTSLVQCIEAAKRLQHVQNVQLSPGLSMMTAVTECREITAQLSNKFTHRIQAHLTHTFQKMASDALDMSGMRHTSEVILRPHSQIHHELLPYSPLVLWLRTADESTYADVCRSYVQHMKKVYENEIKEFMECTKQNLSKERRQLAPSAGIKGGSAVKKSTSTSSLASSRGSVHAPESSRGSDSRGSAGIEEERSRFDHVFNTILNQLDPVCSREQDFLDRFFCFSQPTESTDSATSATSSERRKMLKGTDSTDAPAGAFTKKKMLAELLATIEPEIQSLVQFGDKIDGYNTLYMLVRTSQDVLPPETKGAASVAHPPSASMPAFSFLHQVMGLVLVNVKRRFDTFMNSLVKTCSEQKVNKKVRCGILQCVHVLEEFAQHAENIVGSSERRSDVDKSYKTLLTVVDETIERIAAGETKSPPDVIIFENYHHIVDIIARNKLAVLEAHRDRFKQKYKEHMMSYVTSLLGRPLEKLSIFFDGIEDQFAAGVKPEEIGYRLKYSKAELKKCIREYPGKEVNRGLQGVYKKVEKHLCEEENLLQVVWLTMQNEFIHQYNHFTELIQRCYPDAMISIEFSLEDLLGFFSNIAQQH